MDSTRFVGSNRSGHAALFALLLGAGALAALPAGCGSDGEGGPLGGSGRASEEVGTVSLPLVTQAGGHTYRLRNVFLVIQGPQFTQLSDPGDASLTAISATLATGAYNAILFNGWTLERDDGTGTFAPVIANLVSSQVAWFTIYNGATSTVSYEFQTDGVIVTVGSGQLRITATVDEIAAVCAPFGIDCGEGSWCPPTTLTATARACIPAGSTPVGAPCASPLECVANASCFDLGAGPVCAALCPPPAFGGPCNSGTGTASGTCEAAGVEYGICRPSPAPAPAAEPATP